MAGPRAGLDLLLLAARVLMSVEFILFGIMKIINTEKMQAYMESFSVPGELIWLVIVLQIGAGTLVAIGYQTRTAAVTLAGFCLVATGVFHSDFSDLGEVASFTKDIATAGGFMFLFAYGPGSLSIDARSKHPSQPL